MLETNAACIVYIASDMLKPKIVDETWKDT
jgi:hypothetical protein